jgi:thiol-disulfide isomerase/thioredoxin
VRRAFAFVLSAAVLAAAPGSLGQTALAPGDPAPRFVGFTFPDHVLWRSDWTASRLTLLNFWATWCLPCRDEMPELQKLHEDFAKDGLRIVGAFDHWDKENAAAFLEPLGVTYEIVEAHKTVDRFWRGLTVRPSSFLIDGSGKILRRYVGATPEQIAGLRADIEAVLAGRAMPPQVIPRDATPAVELDYPAEGAP